MGAPNGSADRARRQGWQLSLLNGWRLSRDGTRAFVPMSAQRLVALVAVTGSQARAYVAGTLWPEQPEHRAHGSLRSTLWRLPGACQEVLDVEAGSIALRSEVALDVAEFVECARAVLRREPVPVEQTSQLLAEAGDLLPGWYEEWVLLERERLRQLRIHALEGLANAEAGAGNYASALEIALAAVKMEPRRESANRLVVRIHLAEGNGVEAVRHYERYRELMLDDLGVEPSEQMLSLVRPFVPGNRGRRAAFEGHG
jgi:DNA-binding SARP family transcriptional activator